MCRSARIEGKAKPLAHHQGRAARGAQASGAARCIRSLPALLLVLDPAC